MLLTIHPSLQSVLYCAFIGTVISDIAAVCTLYPSLHPDAQGLLPHGLRRWRWADRPSGRLIAQEALCADLQLTDGLQRWPLWVAPLPLWADPTRSLQTVYGGSSESGHHARYTATTSGGPTPPRRRQGWRRRRGGGTAGGGRKRKRIMPRSLQHGPHAAARGKQRWASFWRLASWMA